MCAADGLTRGRTYYYSKIFVTKIMTGKRFLLREEATMMARSTRSNNDAKIALTSYYYKKYVQCTILLVAKVLLLRTIKEGLPILESRKFEPGWTTN